MGATLRQGPHHGAQKSTRTGTVLFRMSPSKLVSETSWTFGLVVAIKSLRSRNMHDLRQEFQPTITQWTWAWTRPRTCVSPSRRNHGTMRSESAGSTHPGAPASPATIATSVRNESIEHAIDSL